MNRVAELDNRTARIPAAFGAPAALAIAGAAMLGTGGEAFWFFGLLVGAVILRIAWQDGADLTIPDGPVLALAALGAGYRLAEDAAWGEPLAGTLLAMGLDLVLCGGLLLAVREAYFRRRGYDGLGFGDVKLAASGGVLAGTSGFAWALLAASLAGMVVALARGGQPFRPASTQAGEKLPFGAILAPALWVAWVVEQAPRFLTCAGT